MLAHHTVTLWSPLSRWGCERVNLRLRVPMQSKWRIGKTDSTLGTGMTSVVGGHHSTSCTMNGANTTAFLKWFICAEIRRGANQQLVFMWPTRFKIIQRKCCDTCSFFSLDCDWISSRNDALKNLLHSIILLNESDKMITEQSTSQELLSRLLNYV